MTSDIENLKKRIDILEEAMRGQAQVFSIALCMLSALKESIVVDKEPINSPKPEEVVESHKKRKNEYYWNDKDLERDIFKIFKKGGGSHPFLYKDMPIRKRRSFQSAICNRARAILQENACSGLWRTKSGKDSKGNECCFFILNGKELEKMGLQYTPEYEAAYRERIKKGKK